MLFIDENQKHDILMDLNKCFGEDAFEISFTMAIAILERVPLDKASKIIEKLLDHRRYIIFSAICQKQLREKINNEI